MNTYVCDRIEGGFAVLIDRDGETRVCPVGDFQVPPREGDVFDEKLCLNAEETERRRERMKSLFAKRKKKG